MIKVRVSSSATNVNYAPCYLAETLGFFRQNGLEVDASIPSGPGGSWLASNLLEDKADFAMGGIWIPLAYRGRLAELPIMALVCDRNPQVIVSRSPVETFTWQSLYGRKMLLAMAATSQWMFLEGSMQAAGADPARVTFLRDLDAITTMHLWQAGVGDYFLVGALAAQELKADGYHIASTLAALCGPVPWTVYYTSPGILARQDGMADAFVAALQQALDWLHAHDDDAVAEGIQGYFPGVTRPTLVATIRQLRNDGMWRRDTSIPRQPFDAYQEMIAKFGLIDAPFPFADVVAPAARTGDGA